MSRELSYIMTFFGGVGIGAVVAWSYLKKKYDKKTSDEIEYMREVYKTEKAKDISNEEKGEPEKKEDSKVYNPNATTKEQFAKYQELVNAYRTPTKNVEKDTKTTDNTVSNTTFNDSEGNVCYTKGYPVEITPEQLGELDYDIVSYTVYSDGIVADETTGDIVASDSKLDNLYKLLGKENTDKIILADGIDSDVYCIRNDSLKRDFEIMISPVSYDVSAYASSRDE